MATVSFLWHLHQPCYRTADGVALAPWAAIHAGGSYTTLTAAIEQAGGRGQVVNIVPTLLEQLEAYHEGRVTDPVIEALVRPPGELSDEERVTLVEWSAHVNPRQLERYPRLRELLSRRSAGRASARLATLFGVGDLRDLQVLAMLAHAGEQAWRDEQLSPLYEKQRQFTTSDHRLAAEWLLAQPGRLLARWRELAGRPGVEISTSPFAHPIMPLLIDTAVVTESWAPNPAPKVPRLRLAEDARRQLDEALAFMRARGFEPQGCWPPEGSVSAAAVAVYAKAGVRFLVTDEGILERSLGKQLRFGESAAPELYRPWRLAGPCPSLFFRDRWLSDAIGFVYGHWQDEGQAARTLVDNLRGLARTLPKEASIVIALDGENPWPHYAQCGGRFLRELMARLNDVGDELRPATLSEVCDGTRPETLPHLHPGSWINGIFATWIGHPEKTAAWEVLAAVRRAVCAGGRTVPHSLLLAEGSDWFWWLGDDNPTALAPLYDQIFRHHLADACAQAGVEPPLDLEQPLKTVTRPLRVPVSAVWPPPTMDGRVTTYFEWSLAAWFDGERRQPLRRLAAWANDRVLYLLVEGERHMQQLLEGERLLVRLQPPEGDRVEAEVTAAGCSSPRVGCAVGRVVELEIPWEQRSGCRLEVRLGRCQLPEGGAFLLEEMVTDEELGGA